MFRLPSLRTVALSTALLTSSTGLMFGSLAAHAAQDDMDTPAATVSTSDTIEGNWRTIDDKTGFAKAIVRIQKVSNNTYEGTITRIIPRPDYVPKVYCQNCPKPFTDKPILGLHVIWGLRDDPDRPRQYKSGRVLDPLSGHIYNAKARLSGDNRRLLMRGFIGFSALGRTQTWIREVPEKEKHDTAEKTNTP